MNEIVKVFENEEFGSVRTISVDSEPWFVGKDVAAILGYSNPNEAIGDHVDIEDKLNSKTLLSCNLNLGQRGGWLINESGLYSLILSSKLPDAKKFKHWVTSEVLPSIRRHGLFAIDEIINNPDLAIEALTALKEERQRRKELEAENAIQAQQIAEYEPKVTYYDLVLQTKDVLSVTQIAKDYGESANWLNKWLHDNGIQYKVGDTWVLYQKYADKGYTKTKTGQNGERSWVHTYWTQKGRLFLYEKLKEQNILPVIEQD